MGEQRRRYPREYKIEAVRRVIEGRETPAETARALGIQPNLLYGWVRQCKPKPMKRSGETASSLRKTKKSVGCPGSWPT